jgi:hypothetical protein
MLKVVCSLCNVQGVSQKFLDWLGGVLNGYSGAV